LDAWSVSRIIESYMGRGVRQVCPTRGPAGAGADPSAAKNVKIAGNHVMF